MKRSLWEKILNGAKGMVRMAPVEPGAGCVRDDGLDNCDPETNGEYFFLEQVASSCSLVLDVGANEGCYAARVRKFNPSCRVICLEPNSDLSPRIKEKGLVDVFALAAGDTNGDVPLHINTIDATQSSLFRRDRNTVMRMVPCVRLDDFFETHGIGRADLVKIDTEGNEIAVLRGMRRLIESGSVDLIQFEYGGTYLDAGTSLKIAFDMLADRYILCRMLSGGVIPVRYRTELEHYRYSNWMAISRSVYAGD